MKDLLKDNLLWILIPFVLALVAIGVLLWLSSKDTGSTEFVYGL
jgi:hypothetical protein